MSEDFGRQLDAFIEIENQSADLYEMLAKRFSDSQDFWLYLSTVETSYALTATIAREYWKTGRLSEDSFGTAFCDAEDILTMITVIRKKVEDEAKRIAQIKEGKTAASWLVPSLRAAGVLKDGDEL